LKLSALPQGHQAESASLSNITLDAKASYAAAVRKNSQNMVIIKPKNKDQLVTKTKKDIITNIDPTSSSLNVGKVKSLKDGSLLLGCENSTQFKEIVKEKLSTDYEIHDVNAFHPRIRVSGFSFKFSETQLISYLMKQNETIFDSNSKIRVIKRIPTKKNNEVYQVLLEVDSPTYSRAISIGHCLVGLDACYIYDAIEVPRCYNCNGYHHSSKTCRNTLACPRCGDSHPVKNCKSTLLRCCNCVARKANNPTDNIKIDHAAWDYSKCSVYAQTIKKVKSDLFGI
jgi:hypothetical protein